MKLCLHCICSEVEYVYEYENMYVYVLFLYIAFLTLFLSPVTAEWACESEELEWLIVTDAADLPLGWYT
jgi:hypothetical protein